MSGIKVGQGKYYLVNLNADPSLNELLVYYLKVKIYFFSSFLILSGTRIVKKSEKFISVIFSKQLLNYDSVKMSLRGHYAL